MTKKKKDSELKIRRSGFRVDEWREKNAKEGLYNYHWLPRYNHLLGWIDDQIVTKEPKKRMEYNISIGSL